MGIAGARVVGAIWLVTGATGTLWGCAGGESDTIGPIHLSGASPDETQGSSETGDPPGGMDSTTSGPAETSDTPTTTLPPPGETSAAPTTGPVLDCIEAADCDDGDPCTEDNCLNSACDNQPLDCDDDVPCTVDSCNPSSGVCEHATDDAACADADLCNGVEVCDPMLGCQGGTPVTCSDGLACTADACEPATGMCSFDNIDACDSGDGCCPVGCSVSDSDCTCSNLATSATATSSGGGSGAFGPEVWIDGAGEGACTDPMCLECFGWISNDPAPDGAFMQLEWGSDQLVGSMFIDGVGPSGCPGPARGLSGGVVQYWSGGSWVTATTFAGESGDLQFSFNPPFTTRRVRIYNAVAPPSGYNSAAFEWYVYEPLGCTP